MIFISGQADSEMRDVMRETDIPWLRKPFDEEGQLDAISGVAATPV
jgi:hypothetical protein